MNDRIIGRDEVEGLFRLPMGLRLFEHDPHEGEKLLVVSTVQLDGGHLDDPLGIVEPETGFETMVFFAATTFFSLHTRHYKTRAAAKKGHADVLAKLAEGALPLAIPLGMYFAHKVRAAP